MRTIYLLCLECRHSLDVEISGGDVEVKSSRVDIWRDWRQGWCALSLGTYVWYLFGGRQTHPILSDYVERLKVIRSKSAKCWIISFGWSVSHSPRGQILHRLSRRELVSSPVRSFKLALQKAHKIVLLVLFKSIDICCVYVKKSNCFITNWQYLSAISLSHGEQSLRPWSLWG